MAQGRQDPALGHQHVRLDYGFIPGVAGAGRHDGRAVVLGELLVGAVDDGLVAAGRVTPLRKLSGTKIAGAPPKYSTIRTWALIHDGQVLGRAGLGVDVAAGAERADEELDRDDLSRARCR